MEVSYFLIKLGKNKDFGRWHAKHCMSEPRSAEHFPYRTCQYVSKSCVTHEFIYSFNKRFLSINPLLGTVFNMEDTNMR